MSPQDIQDLRASLKLSQRELADRLGIEPSVVANWETGDQFPTKKMLSRLQKLREAPARQSDASPLGPLADPLFWTLVRKLLAHPKLREEALKLAEAYPDPAPP